MKQISSNNTTMNISGSDSPKVQTVVIPPPFPLSIVALVEVIDEFEREEETSMSHIVEEVALTAIATSCQIQFNINSDRPPKLKGNISNMIERKQKWQ
jgi:hypothetical protein